MATINLDIQFNDLTLGTHDSLVMSSDDVKLNYLWGLPLCNPVTGASLPDEVITNKIKAWQDLFENEFGIKLFKQKIREQKDLITEEFLSWGYIQTSWQINSICGLKGRFNERNIITYPIEWLTIKRSNSNDNTPNHQLFIVPNGGGSTNFDYQRVQFSQLFNFRGFRMIPYYWDVTYVTGFDRIPDGIITLIGLATTIDLLGILEMGISSPGGSSAFGLASQSLGFDGLSQSVSKMNGGNIFQQRIKASTEQLKDLYGRIRGTYKGITFNVV